MFVAASVRGGSKDQMLSVASNVNIMMPRMLQRRFAVSSESVRPGTFDDDQFVIQSYPKSQAQRARIQEILSGIVLFQGVSDKIMKDLVGGFFEMKFNNGDKIIVQGDVIADRFFLLESGQCDIFIKKGSADPVKVHTVLPGGFFGELALLYNAPRAATVQSIGESKLWALDRGTFKNCMARASKEEGHGGNPLTLAPKTPQLATSTQQRGSFALIDEQVMKALDQHGKDSVKNKGVPDWHTIVEMSLSSEKFFQRLLKFSHPHVCIYKLSQMDATSPSLLYSEVTDPRHTIFLPLCKVLPTGSANTVLLEGHHLDGSIAFKFTDARDQSQFISIAKKSSEMYSMVNDAYQDVRFISAGGKFQESRTGSAVPNVCGVGLFIDYSKNGSSLTVRDIVPGSPAAACGLISVHDHLLKIGGVSVKHSFSNLEDVVDSIRGIEGTQVSLQFRKGSGPNAKSIYEVTLKRGPNVTAQQSVAIQIGDVHSQSSSRKDSSSFEDHSSNPDLSQQEDVISQDEKNVPSITNSNTYMIGKTSGAESLEEPFSSQYNHKSDFYSQEVPANQFHPISSEQYKTGYQSALVEAFSEPECFLDRSNRALPRDLVDLPDSDPKLSKYLQSFNTASFSSGSTDVFQRPPLQGFATDLGMMLFPTHDHRYIVRSIGSNTPASRQNIMIGDLLWAVDRQSVAFKSQAEVCKLLSRPNAEVHLSFFRNGVNVHTLIPRERNQPGHSPLVGHSTVSAASLQPKPNFPMSSRTTYKSYVPKLSTVPIHAFENGSDARSISTGFSVNKSTVGLFVVTNVICDIRRLEVDDVIVSVDGRVLSPEDALKDVVCMLEEPISTFAQLTLLKYSDGISGVQRKSVQFLRIRGMFGLQRDLKVECPSDFHDSDGHFKKPQFAQMDCPQSTDGIFNHALPNSAHLYDADVDCISEYSDESASDSSVHSSIFFQGSGVGLALRVDETPNEISFIVDRILQHSPADCCGQIDVGDKLIGINGRRVSFDDSLELIMSQIVGVDSSQVALHFMKPKSDSVVQYSVTLTRSPLISIQQRDSPISTNSKGSHSIRLPFQSMPQSVISSGIFQLHPPELASFPLTKGLNIPVEPGAPLEAGSEELISESFDRGVTKFARLRAELEASMDFNCAFRLKHSTTATAIQALKAKLSFKDMMFPSKLRAVPEKD